MDWVLPVSYGPVDAMNLGVQLCVLLPGGRMVFNVLQDRDPRNVSWRWSSARHYRALVAGSTQAPPRMRMEPDTATRPTSCDVDRVES
jgi:hypothetical protein